MSARADPRGGRSAMVVPTATVNYELGFSLALSEDVGRMAQVSRSRRYSTAFSFW